jgi:acyl-CoA synthetase (AMP-forming)/AMP-acid ligase II
LTALHDNAGKLSAGARPGQALTIAGALDVAASRWSELAAIVDGDHRCSYAELRSRALRAASGLTGLGVRKGDRVAICLPNGLDWVVAFYGAVYAGAVVVPLNTALSASELAYQVGHSGASVLVTCAAYRNRDYLAVARQVRDAVSQQLRVVLADGNGDEDDVVPWARLTQGVRGGPALPSLETADPAIMMYTSGTTGRPKGAVQTHAFISTLYSGIDRLEITQTDRLLLYLPLFHIYALVAGMILMTLAGARVVLMARFDAGGSLRLIEQERATILYGIPTTYIDQLSHPAIDTTDFSSLRYALTPLAYDLCQKVRDKIGAPCLNPYGMTETSALSLVARLDDPPETTMRTVGRPLGDLEVKVVDEATGEPVPAGAPGALLIRGPGVLWKYHEQPQATAEAVSADGWFTTGDLVSIDDDGNVTFIGRRGDSYRVGGEMVDPVEVEAAIQSHPAVLRAAALGVPDERLGQVGYAWVEVRPGSGVTEEDLRAHAAGVLAPFKAPRRILLIDELPVTPSGKVRKFRLRESLTVPLRASDPAMMMAPLACQRGHHHRAPARAGGPAPACPRQVSGSGAGRGRTSAGRSGGDLQGPGRGRCRSDDHPRHAQSRCRSQSRR